MYIQSRNRLTDRKTRAIKKESEREGRRGKRGLS